LRKQIDTVVILSTAVVTLTILVLGTAGPTTIFARQNYNLFTAKLSGSNEVPPVTTAASGIATFQLVPVPGHKQVMIYQLSLKNITGVTGAHIHSGKQGENGPVVADLFNPGMTGPATGAINGRLATGTLTQSKLTGPLHGELSLYPLVNMIRSGKAYVNVHTTQNQNGEVRGQIS
jgi:hypothetical protein